MFHYDEYDVAEAYDNHREAIYRERVLEILQPVFDSFDNQLSSNYHQLAKVLYKADKAGMYEAKVLIKKLEISQDELEIIGTYL